MGSDLLKDLRGKEQHTAFYCDFQQLNQLYCVQNPLMNNSHQFYGATCTCTHINFEDQFFGKWQSMNLHTTY